MGLMDILTLPIRLTVATTQAALGMGALASPDGPLRRRGGYADQLSTLLELADRLNKLLADPHGPIALLNILSALTTGQGHRLRWCTGPSTCRRRCAGKFYQ